MVTRRKRIFELKAEFQVPLCIAKAMYDHEMGLPDRNMVWFTGAESEELENGLRRVTCGPLASGGPCFEPRCPDCK